MKILKAQGLNYIKAGFSKTTYYNFITNISLSSTFAELCQTPSIFKLVLHLKIPSKTIIQSDGSSFNVTQNQQQKKMFINKV